MRVVNVGYKKPYSVWNAEQVELLKKLTEENAPKEVIYANFPKHTKVGISRKLTSLRKGGEVSEFVNSSYWQPEEEALILQYIAENLSRNAIAKKFPHYDKQRVFRKLTMLTEKVKTEKANADAKKDNIGKTSTVSALEATLGSGFDSSRMELDGKKISFGEAIEIANKMRKMAGKTQIGSSKCWI